MPAGTSQQDLRAAKRAAVDRADPAASASKPAEGASEVAGAPAQALSALSPNSAAFRKQQIKMKRIAGDLGLPVENLVKNVSVFPGVTLKTFS